MNPNYAFVAKRAGHICEYCHAPEAVFNLQFEVEHIKPLLRGGDDSKNNLLCHAVPVICINPIPFRFLIKKHEINPVFLIRAEIFGKIILRLIMKQVKFSA